MSVPTLNVPLASIVVFAAGPGAGPGAGAGSAWAAPAAQKPTTISAAATALAFVAFVDLMTGQFRRPNHRVRKRCGMMPGVSFRSPSMTEVVATLQVDQIDDDDFVATQLDNAGHHIVGGHIAGQALMAASRT